MKNINVIIIIANKIKYFVKSYHWSAMLITNEIIGMYDVPEIFYAQISIS